MKTTRDVVHRPRNNKVIIAIVGGFLHVNPSEIIKCVARGNQVEIHRTGSRKILKVPASLDHVYESFSDYDFLRFNRSCVINIDHMDLFLKEDGGKALMSKGGKKYIFLILTGSCFTNGWKEAKNKIVDFNGFLFVFLLPFHIKDYPLHIKNYPLRPYSSFRPFRRCIFV